MSRKQFFKFFFKNFHRNFKTEKQKTKFTVSLLIMPAGLKSLAASFSRQKHFAGCIFLHLYKEKLFLPKNYAPAPVNRTEKM